IAFRDNHHGMIGGGEVAALGVLQDRNFARSSDAGKTWHLATAAPFPGPVFGVAYAKHSEDGDDDDDDDQNVTVGAPGLGGTAWSAGEGDAWEAIPGVGGLLSVGFANSRTGWLVGFSGQIFRIDF